MIIFCFIYSSNARLEINETRNIPLRFETNAVFYNRTNIKSNEAIMIVSHTVWTENRNYRMNKIIVKASENTHKGTWFRCVLTNNGFWLSDCHFASNCGFQTLLSLAWLGLAWHGMAGGIFLICFDSSRIVLAAWILDCGIVFNCNTLQKKCCGCFGEEIFALLSSSVFLVIRAP